MANLNDDQLGGNHLITDNDLSQYDNEIPVKSSKMKVSLGGLNINTDYPASTGNYTACIRAKEWIVIHYVGANGKGYSTARYFQTSGRQASAHLVVGLASENGQIYQMIDPKYKAWHCGDGGVGAYKYQCSNSNSIGIETACHNDTSNLSASSDGWYFDDVTVDNLVKLVKYLMTTYNIDINHVIRHYDVTQKSCPTMWVQNEAEWEAFKARLVDDTVVTLVTSVSNKIGISYDYWIKILRGTESVNPTYIKGLFGKVCTVKGKTFTDATLIDVATNILGLNAKAYWASVIAGTTSVTVDNIKALFTKIDSAI